MRPRRSPRRALRICLLCAFAAALAAALPGLKELRRLRLDRNPIRDDGAKAVVDALVGAPQLRYLTLVDLRLIAGNKDEHGRMAVHASFVALFLIVGHVAMVFGMLDPSVLMGEPAAPTHAH